MARCIEYGLGKINRMVVVRCIIDEFLFQVKKLSLKHCYQMKKIYIPMLWPRSHIIYVLEWPIGDPTHVKTRPEPEGFGVGSGQTFYGSGFFGSGTQRFLWLRVFSGIPDWIEKNPKLFKLEQKHLMHLIFHSIIQCYKKYIFKSLHFVNKSQNW